MFDLDLGKMVLVGGLAILVIGPKELPAALRAAGRAVAELRRVQSEIRKAADGLMEEASLEREISALAGAAQINLAANPATAMRGSLAAAAPTLAESQLLEYATPEMQAYLAARPEPAAPIGGSVEAMVGTQ